MGHSDILTWITELRNRVERNELAGRDPINLGFGATIPAERVIQGMLDTLSSLDSQTVRRHEWPTVMTRRLDLLRGFRRLREQIG
jgi:hypothetical protein